MNEGVLNHMNIISTISSIALYILPIAMLLFYLINISPIITLKNTFVYLTYPAFGKYNDKIVAEKRKILSFNRMALFLVIILGLAIFLIQNTTFRIVWCLLLTFGPMVITNIMVQQTIKKIDSYKINIEHDPNTKRLFGFYYINKKRNLNGLNLARKKDLIMLITQLATIIVIIILGYLSVYRPVVNTSIDNQQITFKYGNFNKTLDVRRIQDYSLLSTPVIIDRNINGKQIDNKKLGEYKVSNLKTKATLVYDTKMPAYILRITTLDEVLYYGVDNKAILETMQSDLKNVIEQNQKADNAKANKQRVS